MRVRTHPLHTRAQTPQLFLSAARKDGLLDKPSFDSVVRELVPGEMLSQKEQRLLSYAVNGIFYSFDRKRKYLTQAKELAAGLRYGGVGFWVRGYAVYVCRLTIDAE